MENINFNFFQLLILFGSIQGVIFSYIVVFAKKFQSKSSVFLGLTVLFLSLSNIQHILIDVNYFSVDSIIRRTYIPWQWLVAPMFYLFTRNFLKKEMLNKKELFYLIGPFFIITIVHLIQFVYQAYFDHNYSITDYYRRGLFLYTNLVSFIYIPLVVYIMFRMIINYENSNVNTIEKVQQETVWLKNLVYIGIAIVSLGLISVIIGIFVDMKESFYAYPFFISLSVWIYWVGYVGIQRSSSHKRLEKLQNIQTSKKTGATTFKKINDYIIDEKKYLLADISLNTIADKFEISSGYLSQLVNIHTTKSFNDHINELRVEASKRMLTDDHFNNYTIESIGLECGFKSKSNFYTTFKKFSGQTPNQYKKLKK